MKTTTIIKHSQRFRRYKIARHHIPIKIGSARILLKTYCKHKHSPHHPIRREALMFHLNRKLIHLLNDIRQTNQ